MTPKDMLKKLWFYLWHDDSLTGWIITVIVSFIFVKFIFLPGLGLLLGTPFPVVAVVSSSMEHNGLDQDTWWQQKQAEYEKYDITSFNKFPLKNGFNKGDVIVLYRPNGLEIGDIIVFQGQAAYPIIHRVVDINEQTYTTKGDNNKASRPDETNIGKERIYGKAIFKLPYLGWFKIGFVKLLSLSGIAN